MLSFFQLEVQWAYSEHYVRARMLRTGRPRRRCHVRTGTSLGGRPHWGHLCPFSLLPLCTWDMFLPHSTQLEIDFRWIQLISDIFQLINLIESLGTKYTWIGARCYHIKQQIIKSWWWFFVLVPEGQHFTKKPINNADMIGMSSVYIWI